MPTRNDFWVQAIRLADSYEEAGSTAKERTAYLIEQFDEMPPLARRELLAALRSLAVHLPELYTIAAAREAVTLDAAPQRAAAVVH